MNGLMLEVLGLFLSIGGYMVSSMAKTSGPDRLGVMMCGAAIPLIVIGLIIT